MGEVRSTMEIREAARDVHHNACVRAAQRTTDPVEYRTVLEIVLEPGIERVPPGVLFRLYEHDMGVRNVERRGCPEHLIVVAV